MDVDAGVVCKLSTNLLTENGFKTSIFCKISINGSFEFLGVTDPLRTNGRYWVDNLLVPILDWGFSGTVINLNWVSQPGGRYNGVSVPWRGAVRAHPAYLPRCPEICSPLRATARRVCRNLL